MRGWFERAAIARGGSLARLGFLSRRGMCFRRERIFEKMKGIRGDGTTANGVVLTNAMTFFNAN